MKRRVIAAAAGLLVFGCTVSAYAIQAEIPADSKAVVSEKESSIKIGGEIEVRGWYISNGAVYQGSGKQRGDRTPDRPGGSDSGRDGSASPSGPRSGQ